MRPMKNLLFRFLRIRRHLRRDVEHVKIEFVNAFLTDILKVVQTNSRGFEGERINAAQVF